MTTFNIMSQMANDPPSDAYNKWSKDPVALAALNRLMYHNSGTQADVDTVRVHHVKGVMLGFLTPEGAALKSRQALDALVSCQKYQLSKIPRVVKR